MLLTRAGGGLDDLPRGARVATSSLRRRALLLARRPDLRVEPIRGNVDTRLRKLDEGLYDAHDHGASGARAPGPQAGACHVLPAQEFLPAVGQGILGVEVRVADQAALDALQSRSTTPRRGRQALAERAFLRRLGAGCHTPWPASPGSPAPRSRWTASCRASTAVR